MEGAELGSGGGGDVYGHLLFGHFQCIQLTGSLFPSFETPCHITRI